MNLTNCFAYHITEKGEMCEALKVMNCMKDGKVCTCFRLRNEVEAERNKQNETNTDNADGAYSD